MKLEKYFYKLLASTVLLIKVMSCRISRKSCASSSELCLSFPQATFPIAFFYTSMSLSHELSMSFSLRFWFFYFIFYLWLPQHPTSILWNSYNPGLSKIFLLVDELVFLCKLHFLFVLCSHCWGMPCWLGIPKGMD